MFEINTIMITAYLICCGLCSIVCCFSMVYMAVIMFKYVREHEDDGLYFEEDTNPIGFTQEEQNGI